MEAVMYWCVVCLRGPMPIHIKSLSNKQTPSFHQSGVSSVSNLQQLVPGQTHKYSPEDLIPEALHELNLRTFVDFI